MNKLLKPKIKYFDTTLRDGLQSIPNKIPFKKKCELAKFIYNTYKPESIEVGSLVSKKFLPQMEDSLKLYDYCINNNINSNLYLLIPNIKYLLIAKNNDVKNFSFITSLSENFQKKNTNKTLNESKILLENMLYHTNINNKIKLYISCFNTCPIDGEISSKIIIDEIKYYSALKNIDELCLSDTCGSLTKNKFKKLIHEIKNYISLDIISLHLHKNVNINETESIINYALSIGINKFDVSSLNIGGCSMTINENNLLPNIEYKNIDKTYNIIQDHFDLFSL
jgi:hydroxymethylglutaryl-CoA lyase